MRERLPNVVLVMADQLAAQALPFYGHGIVKAPHLEALADAARRFVRNDAVLGDTERRARLPLRTPPAPDGVSRNRPATDTPERGS